MKIRVAGFSTVFPSQKAMAAPGAACARRSPTTTGAAQQVHIMPGSATSPPARALAKPVPPSSRVTHFTGSSAWTAGNTVNLDGINSGTGSLSTFATRAGYYNSTTNTSAVFTFTVAPPQITTAWNSDNTHITLTATTATTNAIIRYTSDGTEPTATSTLYTAPVQVTGTVILRTFDNKARSSRTATVEVK